MHKMALNFLRQQGIGSFQEVRLLLFLWQHPEFSGTYEQFCDRLYLGDSPLVEQMLNHLDDIGLIQRRDGRFKLANQAELQTSLDQLAQAFDHPLARQQLLAGINNIFR